MLSLTIRRVTCPVSTKANAPADHVCEQHFLCIAICCLGNNNSDGIRPVVNQYKSNLKPSRRPTDTQSTTLPQTFHKLSGEPPTTHNMQDMRNAVSCKSLLRNETSQP